MRYRFSGHETFPLRYSWLPKAVTHLLIDPELFSDEDRAMVVLGIGKNMVRALRFWMVVTGTVEPAAGKYRPTEFGKMIFGERGLDRFLEDRQTLWLLHWNLLKQEEPLFAWDFLHNKWHKADFTRSEAVSAFERESRRIEKSLSRVTLEQHFDVFLHTYFPTRGKKGAVIEDNLDSPFTELDLLEKVGERIVADSINEAIYAFRRETKSDLASSTFIYLLFDLWQEKLPKENTLSFRQIAVLPGSIGQVTKMPEWELRERLDSLKRDSDGLFEYQESASQQRVTCTCDRSTMSGRELLRNIYRAS